jgi:hypothetical protein
MRCRILKSARKRKMPPTAILNARVISIGRRV